MEIQQVKNLTGKAIQSKLQMVLEKKKNKGFNILNAIPKKIEET